MHQNIADFDEGRLRSWINPKRPNRMGVSQIKNQGIPDARGHFSHLSIFSRIAVLTKRKHLHPDLWRGVDNRPPARYREAAQKVLQVRCIDDVMPAQFFTDRRRAIKKKLRQKRLSGYISLAYYA